MADDSPTRGSGRLAARATRRPPRDREQARLRRTGQPGATAEGPTGLKPGTPDRFLQAFRGGPFHTAPLADIPPGLVDLMEVITGEPFPLKVIAAWERIRGFGGYEGLSVDPAMAAQQWLTDPDLAQRRRQPAPLPHTASRAPVASVRAGGRKVDGLAVPPNPDDLGDG